MPQVRAIMLVLWGLSLSATFAAQTPSLPFVVTACVRTAVAPTVDGRLDDACWQRTRPMEPFGKLTLGTPADYQSTGYMTYDDKNLYIGVHCREPEMGRLQAQVTRRDGPVFADDCIEIFLIPPDSSILARVDERQRYFHLVANSLGTRYDEIGLEAPASFDGEWQAKGHQGPDFWELEVAVPFSELGTSARDGGAWIGNISRARWAVKEYSSWAPIQRTFHDKDHFGSIVFTTDLANTEERIAQIELSAVKAGLLEPMVAEIRRAIDIAAASAEHLPEGALAQARRTVGRLRGRLGNIEHRLGALSVANFREQWPSLQARAARLLSDARDAEDEMQMLAATDGGAQGFRLFITPAITNDRLPDNRWPRDVKTLPSLAFTACRGEYESATFSLYAVRELSGVTLSFTDLVGQDGTLPASCIDPYAVKCWYQAGRGIGDLGQKLLTPELLLKDDDLVRVDHAKQRNLVRAQPKSSVYFDATLPDSSNLQGFSPRDAEQLLPLTVPARSLKQFWLTARIPNDAEPGAYRGTVTVRAEGLQAQELPIEVTVLPFDLAEPILEYSIYYRGVLTGSGRGSISSEGKSAEQYEAEMRDLVAHGVVNPTIYQAYDEKLLPLAFEIRKAAGMKGPVMTLGVSTGAPQTPEAIAALKGSVKQWVEFSKARGIDTVYVYGIDEASGEGLKAERAAFEAVHESGAKVFVACYRDYFDLVGDLLDLPVWSGQPDPQEAVKAHGVGHRIFNYGNPQCGVEEPETYRRNFGLALWKTGYDGAMDYAYQHSFTHEWNDFDNASYRDHTMAYPTENGVIDTIQWEGFREGVDDVRYLSTLLRAIADAEAAGGPKAQRAQDARRWVDGLDPRGDLNALRTEMVRRIIEITQ